MPAGTHGARDINAVHGIVVITLRYEGTLEGNGQLPYKVVLPEHLRQQLPAPLRLPLEEVLAHDPRPQYHHDPEREYGLLFAGFNVRFKVRDGKVEVVAIGSSQ